VEHLQLISICAENSQYKNFCLMMVVRRDAKLIEEGDKEKTKINVFFKKKYRRRQI